MESADIVMSGHKHFYPDGGDGAENTRFFANLSLLMANYLDEISGIDPEDMAELVFQAAAAEKKLKERHG